FESAGSVFGAGSIWTVENLEHLQRRLLEEKATTLDEFVARYVNELAPADTKVVQLGAEVLYVHFWINAKSISGATKRAAIERVLATRSECAHMPSLVAAALDMGVVRTGAWFHQNRWLYLHVIVNTALLL